jgi:spore coat protein U-like protein
MCRIPFAALAAVLAFCPWTTATAGTDTDTIAVSVTVQSACALSSSTLDFGTYIAGRTTDLDVEGTIDYTNCSGTLMFELVD